MTSRSLDALKKFPKLALLGCRANLADDVILERLVELKLSTLHLGGEGHADNGFGGAGKVGPKGMSAITKLPLKGLKLNLGMGLSVDDCKRIASMPELQALHLTRGQIGDDHLREIARCPKVTDLRLYVFDVTDAGLEHIRAMPRVRYLELQWSPNVTEAGAKKLAADRPDMRICINGTVIEPTRAAK